ncbi:hypothetical protein [Tenacibaculum sp. 190524A02b]|uniref:hypothetical protein n=1 Tax=Tenacibaculum vairaonense TaxID=3137860 RepID=UPI0031FB95B9
MNLEKLKEIEDLGFDWSLNQFNGLRTLDIMKQDTDSTVIVEYGSFEPVEKVLENGVDKFNEWKNKNLK